MRLCENYFSVEDHSTAIKFLKNSLKKESTSENCLSGILYNNIAAIYLINGNYEKAFQYSKKSLYILESKVLKI